MENAISGGTQIGLQAILDLSNLIKNSSRYDTEINKLKKTNSNFISSVKDAFASAENEGSSSLGRLAERANSIIYGILVADVFRYIGKEIRNLTQEAFGAVSVFQQLRIQMDTIAARDYAEAYGVTVPEALKKTSNQSKELLMWVRQIAVTTPFSVENLGQTLAMSKAYGFQTEEAKRLIIATGNFTAAMGASDDVMKRIIYNMGQMVAQGKPTGRELRDLSNSFVPIGEIEDRFAKKLGTTRAAILKMFQDGTISAREFIDEFIMMVDEKYPGAMDRMANTFITASNNVKDFIQSMIGYEMFGPVADQLSATVNRVIASLLTPENYARASQIGQIILFSFNKLGDVLSKDVLVPLKEFFSIFSVGTRTTADMTRSLLTVLAYINEIGIAFGKSVDFARKFVEGLFSYFGTSFGTLASNMRNWGANIVLKFAEGMASALSAVINVIIGIGNAIANLLESHSPPLLLPDLTKWGTNAMMAYLEGWKLADFDVFNTVSKLISQAIQSMKYSWSDLTIAENQLKSLVSLGDLTEGYRKFGTVSSEALSKLSEAAGFSSNELNKFISIAFKLEEAESILDAITNLLKFEGSGSVTIFDTVVDSFSDMESIANRFGPEISGILTQYSRDMSRIAELDKLITSAQNDLNVTTDKYNSILEELNAQLNKVNDRQEDIGRIRQIDKTLIKTILTQEERERLELEKKEILINRQIRDLKLQQTTEEKVVSDRLDAYQDEQDALKKKSDLEKRNIQSIAQANVSALKGQLDVLQKMIEAQIEFNNLLTRIKDIKVSAKAGSIEIDEEEIQKQLQETFDNAIEGLDVQKALKDMWDEIWKDVEDNWSKLAGKFSGLTPLWNTALQTWKDLFKDPKLTEEWNKFTDTITTGLNNLKKAWDTDGASISEAIGNLIGGIVTNLFITTDKTGKSVLQILADSFTAITDTLVKNKGSITEIIDKISEFINEKAFPEFKKLLEFIGTKFIPATISFVVQAAPTILTVLGFVVDNAPIFLALFAASKIFSSTLSGMVQSLGFIVGALAILTKMKPVNLLTSLITGISAARAATATAGATGAAATGAKIGLGQIISRFSPFLSLLTLSGDTNPEMVKSPPATYKPGAQYEGATRLSWSEYIDQTFGPISDWISGVFGQNGTLITWISTLAPSIENWIQDAFGEGSTFHTLMSGIFGENGTISIWLSSTFGENGTVSKWLNTAKSNVEIWSQDTFGEGSPFHTWMSNTFGENGTISVWLSSAFGENGTVSVWFNTAKDDIDTWASDTFGEGGILDSWLMEAFGDEGTVIKWFSDTFGEDGTIMIWIEGLGSLISAWILDTFKEGGTIDTWILDMKTAAKLLIDGFWQGLVDKKDEIVGNIKGYFQDLINAAKGALQEHSQSKIAYKMGKDFVLGLANGIADNMMLPSRALALTTNPLISSPISNVTNYSRTVNYNRNTSVTVNPSYESISSPSNIYYDVSAALASTRL